MAKVFVHETAVKDGVRLALRVTFTLKGRSQVIVVIGGKVLKKGT